METTVDQLQKYYFEALSRLKSNNRLESLDPDVIRVFDGFALLESRLRWEIENKDNSLVKFLIAIMVPELIGLPPDCGVIQLEGQVGHELLTYSEFVSENSRWRITRNHTIVKTTIDKMIYLTHEEDANLNNLGIKNAILLELSSVEKILHIYINSDFDFSSKLLMDILSGGSQVVDYSTGEVVGNLTIDEESIIECGNILGDPYTELYELAWLSSKYKFFTIRLNKVKTKMSLLIRTSGMVRQINNELFRLNCAPVSGLFLKHMSPFKIKATEEFYPIIGDILNPDTCKIYKIKEVTMYDQNKNCNLIPGKDYFIKWDKTGFSIKFTNDFNDKMVKVSLLCVDKKLVDMNKDFICEEKNYIKGKIIKLYKSKENNLVLDYSTLSLYRSNNFQDFLQSNQLFQLVKQMNQIFNLENNIVDITSNNGFDIMKHNQYFGLCSISTINIKIDRNNIGFISALVWARIFMRLAPISLQVRVKITDISENIIYEINV